MNAKNKFVVKLFDIWRKLFFTPLSITGNKLNFLERFMIETCKGMEKRSEYFVSFNMQKKIDIKDDCTPKHKTKHKIIIVMQGPLLLENNFTYETAKFYSLLPSVDNVIVSTWVNEDNATIEKLRKTGIVVLQTTIPQKKGIGNINLQLVNSKVGVFKAKELGADYICKTRTDQRICNEFSFDTMANLIDTFPPDGAQQKKRIFALSTDEENLFFPYYISDFVYFGHCDEICRIFSIPLDDRILKKEYIDYYSRVCEENNAEVYIMREYIKLSQMKYDVTIKDYWRFIKDYLILSDKSFIDLYWPKYDSRYCIHRRNGHPINLHNNKYIKSNFDFSSWLSLYYGLFKYDAEYEKIIHNKNI